MKWLNDIKDSASAFKEWARMLTIIGIVIASSLVAIAIELAVICIKLQYKNKLATGNIPRSPLSCISWSKKSASPHYEKGENVLLPDQSGDPDLIVSDLSAPIRILSFLELELVTRTWK